MNLRQRKRSTKTAEAATTNLKQRKRSTSAAARRSFSESSPELDWLETEAEINLSLDRYRL